MPPTKTVFIDADLVTPEVEAKEFRRTDETAPYKLPIDNSRVRGELQCVDKTSHNVKRAMLIP